MYRASVGHKAGHRMPLYQSYVEKAQTENNRVSCIAYILLQPNAVMLLSTAVEC